MYLCQFCNETRSNDHIEVCPNCKGQLHVGSAKKVCALCGKSFDLDKTKKVEKHSDVVKPEVLVEPKELMILKEEG